MISMADGTYKPVETIVAGDMVLTINEHTYALEAKPVLHVHDNGVKEKVCVVTASGKRLDITPNHPLLVNNCWTQAQHIKPGDLVAVPRVGVFGDTVMVQHEVDLLAIWLAEGHGYCISNTTPEIIALVRNLADVYGAGLTVTSSDDVVWRVANGNRTGGSAAGSKNPMRQALERFGVWGKNSKTKFIPDAVFRLGKDQLARFLNLFVACDGSVNCRSKNTWAMEIGLANEHMVKQLANLFLKFGVRGNISKKVHRATSSVSGEHFVSWRFIVSDSKSLRIFCEQIGALSKELQVAEALAACDVSAGSCNSYLPISHSEFVQHLRYTPVPKTGAARKGGNNAVVARDLPKYLQQQLTSWRKQTPSRMSERRYAALRDFTDGFFDKSVDGDFVWDEVKAVEPSGNGQTWDLTIEDNHNFIAEGMVTHNTALARVLMITRAKKKKQKIWYVAPTYKMAKQIMWLDLLDAVPRRWVRKINETSLSITLINGTRLELKGADKGDCYDDETEILTPEGWAYLKHLPEGLPVMTLNPKTNQAEWQMPVRYIHQNYDGPMYRLKSGKVDLLVTPNHRFLVDTRKGARKFKTLDQVAHQDSIPASVDWVGTDDEDCSHDWMAFMGFYLAEGCARKNPGEKCSYEIDFAQTAGIKGGVKGDVRAKFLEVLHRLGAKPRINGNSIRISGRKWWDKVSHLGLAWEKRIPQELLDLPPGKLNTLLHWMIQGDGTETESGRRVYYTTSKGMAGDVQELCMKIGLSANIVEKPQVPSALKDGRTITPKRPLYAVKIYRNKRIHFQDSKEKYISETTYKGGIHCVEVPNHVVYVRRNGKVTWSGNSLRGVGVDFLVLDEFQDMQPEVWTQVLRPTLADRRGDAIFIGTPRAYNHLYELHQKGQDALNVARNLWQSWQFPTITSPFIPISEIEAARRDMDEKSFAQEFEASFTNMSGRVYYPFDRLEHCGAYPFNPKLPIWVGMDFNIDPMSTVLFQPQKSGELWAVDEIVLFGSNTEEICDELERRYWRHQVQIIVYPDPAGGQRQHARGETDLDILREKGFKRLKYRRKHPFVADRVNAVNRMLKAADGSIRLRIDDKCGHFVSALEQTIYKKGSRDVDKSGGTEHSADAGGYCIELEYPVRKVDIGGMSR